MEWSANVCWKTWGNFIIRETNLPQSISHISTISSPGRHGPCSRKKRRFPGPVIFAPWTLMFSVYRKIMWLPRASMDSLIKNMSAKLSLFFFLQWSICVGYNDFYMAFKQRRLLCPNLKYGEIVYYYSANELSNFWRIFFSLFRDISSRTLLNSVIYLVPLIF